ncbi:uncharacterized protein LOC143286516 isoform X2 [Babylonia areolata]|uniref:uncharacterized protein LOC143286516 isoform X2 n=1 Tax=Babylonia areolata TaxID=304850 RepID=UPI003FCF3402
MDSDGSDKLCSLCTGRRCEADKCQCQKCHQDRVHSPPAYQCQDTAACPDSAQGCVAGHRDDDKHGGLERSASFGFKLEGERTELSGATMSVKEQTPVYYGEVTPEQPDRRTKGTPAGQEARPSPLTADDLKTGKRHVRQLSQEEEAGSCHAPSPFQTHHAQGHHHGNTLRSDAYLRQALTSPYNQRGGEKAAMVFTSHADSRGGSRETSVVYSPSLWREGMAQIHSSPQLDAATRAGLQDSFRHWAGGEVEAGHDQIPTFKTPLKSIRSSPDRTQKDRAAVSGSSSPSSSASGSSGSGSHHSGGHQNPFDLGHERLHFPVFSPGMFNMPQTPGSAEKGFQWNVEHLAELRPVHIDEKDIKRQLSKQCHDEEADKRAQRAIDYYFQHHMVAPSPWSEAPPPHVLPATPCGPSYDDLFATTPNQARGSIQKDLPRSRKGLDKSSQTTLTLPVSLDLEKLLGEYMTYQETERDESMGMSSSSLRRKLFFNPDSSSILSPVRSGQKSPDHLSAALSTPPKCRATPEWERGSPIHTPSSVQFSSSPIRGPLGAEGDYFRSSFSEHGPLASPELSPIADKHRVRGRFRQSLGFDAADDGLEPKADLGFGSPIRKQLQMEVHDGSSPRGRPSPDVSPIAVFEGSGQHSRSRTLRADMSHTLFSPPQHLSPPTHPSSSSPPPDLASLPTTHHTARTQRISVSMDTDTAEFLPSAYKDTGPLSPRDSSMTEETLAEGGTSGLDPDTLQHPSSASYPDTGYQTGSGNGSLQTTQEGGVSMATSTSTDALSSLTDTGTLPRKLASKLQPGGVGVGREQGLVLRTSGEEARASSSLCVEESSVDGLGTSVDPGGVVAHSNLTSQFMRMPVHAELSVDSMDLVSTGPLPFQQQAHEKPSTFEGWLKVVEKKSVKKDKTVDGFSSGSSRLLPTRNAKESVSVDPPDFEGLQDVVLEGVQIPQGALRSHSEGDLSEEDDQASSTPGSYIYRRDADFLNKMGEYLEKGGELSSDDGADKGAENVPPPSSTKSPPPPTWSTYTGKGPDDSVLERAHQYLASVNHPQALGNGRSTDTVAASAAGNLLPSAKPGELSTPAKRLLGRVADDLTAGREKPGSPALASEVAKELIRRAEMDLKRLRHAGHKSGSS